MSGCGRTEPFYSSYHVFRRALRAPTNYIPFSKTPSNFAGEKLAGGKKKGLFLFKTPGAQKQKGGPQKVLKKVYTEAL